MSILVLIGSRGGVQFYEDVVTLPETNIAPTNGWLEYYFPLFSYGGGLFSGAMLVSRRVSRWWFQFFFMFSPRFFSGNRSDLTSIFFKMG